MHNNDLTELNENLSNNLGSHITINTSSQSMYTMPNDGIIVVNATVGQGGGNGQVDLSINSVVRFRQGVFQDPSEYGIHTNSNSFRVHKNDVLSWTKSGNGVMDLLNYPYSN